MGFGGAAHQARQLLLGHARGDQALQHDHEATRRLAQRVVGFHLEELEELLPHLVHD